MTLATQEKEGLEYGRFAEVGRDAIPLVVSLPPLERIMPALANLASLSAS